MPFYQQQTRNELRQMYVDAWRKRREHLPTEPVEAQIADVIEAHPEYHSALERGEATVERDFLPEGGQTNPFLHMGLHLAVRDQVATDRPSGIRAAFTTLCRQMAPHDAEHVLLECLAEALWQAQSTGQPPDERAYLERIRQRSAP